MCRYPVSMATATESRVSSGGVWKTPKPMVGISTPLFKAMFGTSCAILLSLQIVVEARALDLRRGVVMPIQVGGNTPDGSVVVGKRGGHLSVGIHLGEQLPGLLLDTLDRIGTGHPAHRRLVLP